VQFHPEWMTQLSWAMGLFSALVEASRGYSAIPREEIEPLLEEVQAWLRQQDRALYGDGLPFARATETQSERHEMRRAAFTLQRTVV
jgi:hypothetical protein